MAQTKRSTRSSNRQDKYTAQLSSGQLVIGVCILLVFGLACFLLGVLIGKFEPSMQETVAKNNQSPAQTQTNENTVTNPVDAEREFKTVKKLPPPELRLPPQSSTVTNKEPDPAPEKKVTETSSSVPESTRDTKAPEKQELDKKQPAAAERVKIAENTPLPQATTPETTEAKKVANLANTAKPSSRATLTLQVAAFKIRTNAEKERKRLQNKTPYPVSLMETPGSNYIKVIIGGFNDRDSAEKTRKELLTKYGFKDVLITKKY